VGGNLNTVRALGVFAGSALVTFANAQGSIGYEITRVIFQSDHGLLRDGPNNFASDGTGVYVIRGFDKRSLPLEPIANPVSHTKNL
jgi:hypothetical protein